MLAEKQKEADNALEEAEDDIISEVEKNEKLIENAAADK